MAKKNSTASKKPMIFNSVILINTDNLVSLVKSLPKTRMNADAFNTYMKDNFYWAGRFHGDDFNSGSHYSTVVRQLGLYQILNNEYIPRFTTNIDNEVAESFLRYWLKLYIVPNPTSQPSIKKSIPTPKFILKEIIEYIQKYPLITNIYDILDIIFEQELSRNDKGNLPNIIKNYSGCIDIDDNNNVLLKQNYKQVMDEINDLINNPNRYFEHFGKGDVSISKKGVFLQRIYYGAPGTGKSNEIKVLTGRGKNGVNFTKDFTFRTTFHPDSDYSSFVGAYKPVWDSFDNKIIYKFRPQSFLKAYVAAWTHPQSNVALVIEEINRGNCAQIFGDIFQLLDRETNGLSKYPIESDIDMETFLSGEFNKEIDGVKKCLISEEALEEINNYYSNHYDDAFDKIKTGKILTLPKNLSFLATMNTSDQSLFPMDSAFKRRWDWIYEPIREGIDSTTGKSFGWKIKLDGYKLIDWWEFLERINIVISDQTTSEDKQLGYFFCTPDEMANEIDTKATIISAELFVGKVIFYLWNDVFKDYAFDVDCCKDNNGKEVLFAKFFLPDGKNIDVEVLAFFFNKLKDKDGNENPLAIKLDGDENDKKLDEDVNPELVSAKFSIDDGEQMTLVEIVKQIVLKYIDNHPNQNAAQIRDAFVAACKDRNVGRVIETEDEYSQRRDQSSAERTVVDISLENGEKLFVSTQWRAKRDTDNFFNFVKVVNEKGWGNITRIG